MPPLPSTPPMTRRRLIQTALWGGASLVTASTLSSCRWRLANVQNQRSIVTTKLDTLHIYTWSSYIDEALLKTFKRQTGVKGISEVMASNEEMLAAFEIGKGKVFSLICPSDYMVQTMQEKGYLQELVSNRLPDMPTLLPNLASIGMVGEKRYSVPLTWGTTGFLYNTKKITGPIDDWDYLWKYREQLTRRITLLDDSREVFGMVLHSLGYSQNTSNLNQLQQAYEKLQQLKSALASFTTDAWRDPLIAGDLWISMCYSTDATDLVKDNPHLRYVIPTSGTNLWVDTMVIPVTAPNPEAAYDWVNYVTDATHAAALSQQLGYVPVTQAAIDLLPAAVRSDPVKFPAPEVMARCDTLKPMPTDAAEALERYWMQMKT
jgi:spermidine/putrescine transport system substrate-binding protein